MKTERVVLSFIAVIFGLLVAGVAFFIYQSTKTIAPSKITPITITQPTPTPSSNVPLTIDQPANESVVKTKSITISGKSSPNSVLVLTTDTDDQVVNPASNGNYSITTTLSDGTNQATITAIAPDGLETKKTITITYSTEEF